MSQPGNTHRVVCVVMLSERSCSHLFSLKRVPQLYTPPAHQTRTHPAEGALLRSSARGAIRRSQRFPRPWHGRNLQELEPVGPGRGYNLRHPVSWAPRRGDERGWWSGTRTGAGRRGAGPRPPRVGLEPMWVIALGVGITPGGEGVGRLQLLFLIEPWAPRFNGLVKMM